MLEYSFVIPVYKRKKLLRNTLEALNNLTNVDQGDYEVIVVDDGSDDDTYSYIQGVNQSYELKYYDFKKNKQSYCAPAKNFGWKQAAGAIIIFIDSDIIVRPDYLDEVGRYYSADEDIMIIGVRIFLPEDITYETIKDRSFFSKYSGAGANPDWFELRHRIFSDHSYNSSALRYPWLEAFGCNMVAPKKWLEKVGGFDENFKNWGLEDVELACSLFSQGLKIVINSRMEVFHQPHHNNKDVINPEMYQQIDDNTRYFLSKHPDALEMPVARIYEMFKGFVPVDFRVDDEEPHQRIILEYHNPDETERIKNQIMAYSGQKGLEIIVYDHLENTDLDIWIQLLGKRNSTPKYYPLSKVIPITTGI